MSDLTSNPAAALTLVTLGVGDLARSIAFYEALGFSRKLRKANGVGFFSAGGVAFAVFPITDLAHDCGLAENSAGGFRGVALAWNCASERDVDAAYQIALQAGAKGIKPPQRAFWGGYQAYFSDPDGHLWEVAHNPSFPLLPDGRMQLPD